MTRNRFFLGGVTPLALLLTLAPLGCGDDGGDDSEQDGEGGSSGQPEMDCDEPVGPIDPTALIDDLEDGNSAIANGSGSWWLSTDMTGGTVTPVADNLAMPERILGSRCESNYGMRVTGQGFTSWGVSLSANFRYTTQLEPIDVSSYAGVRFWARRGETHTSPVRVQFQDKSTYPLGGLCRDEPNRDDSCYNGFGTDLPLSTEWQLFELPFARLAPREFGLIPESFDTTQVYQIEFNVMQDTVFDFWVDDLWFYD